MTRYKAVKMLRVEERSPRENDETWHVSACRKVKSRPPLRPKHDSMVPVKFTLTQDGASTCTLPAATIAVTRTAGGTLGSVNESVYSMSADRGSNFRINSCQYVYNLNSGALGAGTYRVDIKINGSVVGTSMFGLQ
jgi:hypothetical protein